MGQRYGLYRAQVVSSTDPAGLGRLQVSCAQLFGNGTSDWILALSPGGTVTAPKVGSQGYISFEAGDEDHPVWLGNSSAAIPAGGFVTNTTTLSGTITANISLAATTTTNIISANLTVGYWHLTATGLFLGNAGASVAALLSFAVGGGTATYSVAGINHTTIVTAANANTAFQYGAGSLNCVVTVTAAGSVNITAQTTSTPAIALFQDYFGYGGVTGFVAVQL